MGACFDLPRGMEEQDWKVFYHVYYRLNPWARVLRFLLRLMALCAGGLMALIVIGVAVSGDPPRQAVIPSLIGLTCVLGVLFFDRLNRWSAKRRSLGEGKPMVVTIGEEDVKDETGSVVTRYGYDAFFRVCYCRDTFLLFLNAQTALVLPERARTGASSLELQQFLEQRTGKTIQFIK